MKDRRWRAAALLLVVVVPLAGALMVRRFESRLGLTGTYFRQPDWQQAASTVVDSAIGTRTLKSRFESFGENQFSVDWRGLLAIEHEGRYEFATRSDDGSTLLIDGAVVVDNGGPHGSRIRAGQVFLRPGFHPIQLTYQQLGGGYELEMSWRTDSGALEPIPRTALLRDITISGTSWRAYRFVTWMRRWMFVVPFVWIALCELWLLQRFAASLWRFIGTPSFRDGAALAAILAVSTTLNVVGLTWGLPDGGWAPDEVVPVSVFYGASAWFSGGWFGSYPPFHYYVLSVFYAPFWALWTIANAGAEIYPRLVWVNRLASVQMALATLVVVYAMGRSIRGVFAGLVAVAATALLPAFVYYSKIGNLEIPYVFWSMCALAFYGRAIMRGSRGDYWRFALFATLAVCTKDQAYGLFVLPAFHLATARARQRRRESGRWSSVVVDPVLGQAILVAVAAFAIGHNLLFNWAGFISHVRRLTQSEVFQAFPATPLGQWQMLVSSVSQLPWLFGWPMASVVVIAVAATLVDRRARRRLWVVLPAVSYYLFFVCLALYNYDRFFLPVCVLAAVLVGCWAEDLRERMTPGPIRFGMATAACAIACYTFAYAASIDRMMLYDARYGVEDWMRANVPVDARIGAAGFLDYLPRINTLQRTMVDYEGLKASPPEFVVVNREYLARLRADTDLWRLYMELLTGNTYRLVLSRKTDFRFAPLTTQDQIANRIEESNTNLDKINPEIEVFQSVNAAR